MRGLLVVAATLALAACGGGAESSPGDLAAKACEASAKSRLDGKEYSVDLVALAASMKEKPGGTHFLTSPIVIEPGLTSETKQIIECTVRFTPGKTDPDVINFVFNW